ncbi:hypothetical protein RHGRI_026787 [Rhododendron griersonianum]|uniref:Uncharacterized protein n=1 Tax=Rhododendron griersonianum TaxID=479676 RepID=A0AAV6IU23_9ERIC|nr:hypothetical protein RHGRI_026787 [Rhododendron griersonianum]
MCYHLSDTHSVIILIARRITRFQERLEFRIIIAFRFQYLWTIWPWGSLLLRPNLAVELSLIPVESGRGQDFYYHSIILGLGYVTSVWVIMLKSMRSTIMVYLYLARNSLRSFGHTWVQLLLHLSDKEGVEGLLWGG